MGNVINVRCVVTHSVYRVVRRDVNLHAVEIILVLVVYNCIINQRVEYSEVISLHTDIQVFSQV